MKYKIKSGDTLSAIAKSNNTTVEELAKMNGISNPDLIYAGSMIEIPDIKPVVTPSPASISSPTGYSSYSSGTSAKPVYSRSSEVESSEAALKNHESTKPSEYESKYQELIDELLDKIMNRESFSYDFNADPVYQQYRDRYLADGKLAMKDMIGEASALTGGYANSYAVAAGNSAYNSYLTKLSGVIPSLMEAAYKRYRDKWADADNDLSRLLGLDATDYSRYRDSVSDYYDQWDRLYKQYSDLSDDDYRRYLDALSQWNTDRQYDRSVYEDERDAAYRAERDAVADSQWERELALALMKATSSSSSSSSNSSSSSSSSKSSNEMTYAKCSAKARKLIDLLSEASSYGSDGQLKMDIRNAVRDARNAKQITSEEYKYILSLING